MTQTAEYKGRKYRLEWMGQTKFGRRAKLAFFDGSKEFWAAASEVAVCDQPARSYGFRSSSSSRRQPSCRVCKDRHDGSTVCWACGQED